MALVTATDPADVAVALGVDAPTTGSTQAQQWQMFIGDALMLIQNRVDELQVDEADISQVKIDYVVREAVVAHVRRPDDATQVTIQVDDGQSSKTYRTGAGRVTILDEWWTMLGLTGNGGQAFGIDTVSSSATHQPWCSLMMGALFCSCGADLTGSFPLWEY